MYIPALQTIEKKSQSKVDLLSVADTIIDDVSLLLIRLVDCLSFYLILVHKNNLFKLISIT